MAVNEYVNWTCKKMIYEKAVGAPYDNPGRVVRDMFPIPFARKFVLPTTDDTDTLWEELLALIPANIGPVMTDRCFQAVLEFSVPVYGNATTVFEKLKPATRAKMQLAVRRHSASSEHRTMGWILDRVRTDHNLLRRIVFAIETRSTGNVARQIPLATFYVSRLYDTRVPKRDVSKGVSARELRKLRRAYERILFLQIPIDDMTNKGSVLNSLVHSYTRSYFGSPSSRRTTVIPNNDGDDDLVLTGDKHKPFSKTAYLGALEHISRGADVVYVDARLGQHICFDCLYDIADEGDTGSVFFKRLELLCTEVFSPSPPATVPAVLCEKESLLEAPQDADCAESNRLAVACHVDSFLSVVTAARCRR